jgi:hypothetical protein
MGQRASYGIDGGFAGLAVFGTVGAGLACAGTWAARHGRPGHHMPVVIAEVEHADAI